MSYGFIKCQRRYKGTNRIADYNRSESHRIKCRELAYKRHTIKGARGFNSEYSDRLRNYNNIINRESADHKRFLYLIEFDSNIKVGSTSTFNRRMFALSPESIIRVFEGGSHEIAKLEFDTLVKFENYTLLNQNKTAFTEYLDKCILPEIISYLDERVSGSTTIRKVDNT